MLSIRLSHQNNIGISILSHCLSRRLAVERLTTLQGVSQLPWARAIILLVFLDSWLFLFTSMFHLFLFLSRKYLMFLGGVIIFGVGLDRSSSICSVGIILCVVFYATSKAFIYMFLSEFVNGTLLCFVLR